MADAHGESAEFQTDRGVFRAEYERELGQWLRRRLGWLCIAYAVFQIGGTVSMVMTSAWLNGSDGAASGSAPSAFVTDTGEGEGDSQQVQADSSQANSSQVKTPQAKTPQAMSPIDAVVEIAREVRKDQNGKPASPPQPIGRMVDRWWEDTIAPITEHARSAQQDGTPDPAAQEAPAASNQAIDVEAARPRLASEDEFLLRVPWWVWVLLNIPSIAVIGWFGLEVRPRLYTRAELVTAASRMILILGFLTFGLETGILLASPNATVFPIFSIFFWHLTASLFLPWNWRESLRPIVPLFLSWVLLRAGLAAGDHSWITFGLSVAFAPLLFLPAILLCYIRLRWHQNRFKSGFVGRRFLQMRREFMQARAVHESLFPKPADLGWLRFDFGYRPAADIGGDFIHVWIDERERFHLALIDVTGHGLASAMSVARIHGEIERLRDEYPDEGPAKILARLNRYFHRLLAKHKLYATGVLLTIDPHSGEVRYASAGHPPVFLRSRGKVTELASTTFLLGAVEDSLFGEEELSMRLEEGDTLVLFTDGAYDARSPRGERFGLDRLREILQRPSAPPRWTQYLMRLVETFEAGMPEDDLLIAELTFVSRRSLSSITGDDLPQTARTYAEARG